MDRVLILVIAAFLAGWCWGKPAHAADQNEQAHNKRVICRVFGPRYCGEALRVAWCESRHLTGARNGQYAGLLQLGAWERRTFAHGRYATAEDQARAAYRYFLATGRTWRPWACRWAAYTVKREMYP